MLSTSFSFFEPSPVSTGLLCVSSNSANKVPTFLVRHIDRRHGRSRPLTLTSNIQ